ncbi:hypothetical protein MRB53_019741 [Persea americana]|uniref:Uncharacterized protein n=1 Tax=Persea americana TaxID=3435 RepID=A0ACC2KYZ2_PERAE|nr:hypothetical protein MRB53_019741 [Persea americana]
MVPRSSPPCAPRLSTPPSTSKTASVLTALASSMITLSGRPIRTIRLELRDWRERRRSATDLMRKERSTLISIHGNHLGNRMDVPRVRLQLVHIFVGGRGLPLFSGWESETNRITAEINGNKNRTSAWSLSRAPHVTALTFTIRTTAPQRSFDSATRVFASGSLHSDTKKLPGTMEKMQVSGAELVLKFVWSLSCKCNGVLLREDCKCRFTSLEQKKFVLLL